MNLFIYMKKILIFMCFSLVTLWTFGQEGFIEGIVISSSGDSLKNVKITVKENPNVEVYTDGGGNFSISAEAGQHLVIEYKNKYEKIVEISIIEKEITIVLDKASELVNVGFGMQQRSEVIASSVGIVRSEKLEQITAHSPGNALFGQVSGLRVFQNTGLFPEDRQPGMDIRGLATIQDNSILVLIDGVERPLNTLVPEEIESVTVLRDAAAKAKYGQLGANGVLLVNTKRGSKGKTQYNISFEQGVSQSTRLPEFLDAPGYAMAVNEAMINDGLDPKYTQLDIDRFKSGEYPTFWPNVNWVDQTLTNMSNFSRFNFNMSGGNEEINFYVSLNYQNDHGLYNHTEEFEDFSTQLDYDKVNFRTNLDIDLTPSTFAQVNFAGYVMSHQRPKIEDIVGDAFAIPSALFPVKNYDGSWGGTNLFGNNPVAELSATGYNLMHKRNFLIDVRLNQDLNSIVEGLSAELFLGYDNQANFWENLDKTYRYREVYPAVNSVGAIVDTIVNELGQDTELSPMKSAGDIQLTHYDLRGKLKYTNYFGVHAINGVILFQQEQKEIPGTNNSYRHRNLVGNLHYGMFNKYFLDATVSYYGTNRIQEENKRYGMFPAIAGAWVISKESFMSDVDFVNSLKLRASYGKVGNGRITMWDLTHAQYGSVSGYVYGDNYNSMGGFGETQIPIESKTFESSIESNLGIEARLFDKLDFNGELFYTKRKNIFVPSVGQYSEVIGILPEQTPSGIVENKGYELDLTWSDQSGDFTYFITGRFSQYRSKIIDINEEYRPYDYMKREGQSIGQYFGWESEGFYPSEIEIQNSAFSQFSDVQPGDIMYLDQNGDGYINEFDQKPIGNSWNPEIYYSATLSIGYKGFHVSALFQGTQKSSVYLNQPHVFLPIQSNGNISTWYDNYWTENNKAGAELPRLTTVSNENNFRINDIWIRDNSFLKLRYAEISYSFPKSFISNFNLQQVNIYLRGRNLFSLDEINYVDPENTNAHYPALRTYNAGIEVTF